MFPSGSAVLPMRLHPSTCTCDCRASTLLTAEMMLILLFVGVDRVLFRNLGLLGAALSLLIISYQDVEGPATEGTLFERLLWHGGKEVTRRDIQQHPQSSRQNCSLAS